MFDTPRAKQLKKLIADREAQIKEIKTEISEMYEELKIFEEIEIANHEIEKIEKEISEIRKNPDFTHDWQSDYEEAYEDKYWHAVEIAREHLSEKRYLQGQIYEKERKISEIKNRIKSLENKKKEIYQKTLVEDNSEQTEPCPQ